MGIDVEMYAEVPIAVTPADVFAVSRRMVDCLGPGVFWLGEQFSDYLKAERAPGQTKPHALIPVAEIGEDSERGDFGPPPGMRFVMVSLGGRYYGRGYERGAFAEYASIAHFLKTAWPDARVFYGGDSSGVRFVEWTPAFEREMWAHFVEVGHAPYIAGFSLMDDDGLRAPTCDRCLVPMPRHGFGLRYGAWHCPSCNAALETHDGGATLTKPKAVGG